MPYSESFAALPPRDREIVKQMMISQAYRELLACNMFGYCLQFVPSIKWLKFQTWHVQEEAQHYFAVAELYKKHVGEPLEQYVMERIAQRKVTFAQSFLELAFAQWLYDRGGFWQLHEYQGCTWEPYSTIVDKIIAEEEGHQETGRKLAVDLCNAMDDVDLSQPLFNKWLKQGLLSFGRPNSEANAYAIKRGLKKRDSGDVMIDYMNDVIPTIRECRLQLPSKEELGLELPPNIPWSL